MWIRTVYFFTLQRHIAFAEMSTANAQNVCKKPVAIRNIFCITGKQTGEEKVCLNIDA